jgi:hypothetical protein
MNSLSERSCLLIISTTYLLYISILIHIIHGDISVNYSYEYYFIIIFCSL